MQFIFFDFDGVILDSMRIRTEGFREIFRKFDPVQVEALIEWHLQNGGISRYEKIRRFFEVYLKQPVPDETILEYAKEFSLVMQQNLVRKDLLIQDTVQTIKELHKKIPLYIASGADQTELRWLCDHLELSPFFEKILGSPKPKCQNLKELLQELGANPADCVMIGDSYNDFEAANSNKIPFLGFNNPNLKRIGLGYLEKMQNLYSFLRNVK